MELPTFNSTALMTLTDRIDSRLKNHKGVVKLDEREIKHNLSKAERNRPDDSITLHGSLSKANKRLRNGRFKETNVKSRGKKDMHGDGNRGDLVTSKENQLTSKENQHVAKNVLKGTPKKHKDIVTGAQPLVSQHSATAGVRSKFRDEILALGGNGEDIRLFEDAQSESEIEGSAIHGNGKELQDELQKLAEDLGIRKAAVQDQLADSSEDELETVNDKHDSGNHNNVHVVSRNRATESLQQSTDIARASSHIYFEPRSEWHSADLPPLLANSSSALVPIETINRLHELAKQLLDVENQRYSGRSGTHSSAHQFYATIMSSGTLSDKISALTLSVQESPVHNMKAFESLVGLAGKRSRSQAVEVLGALKDLLGPGSLLPSDRKLRTFAAQPGMSALFAQQIQDWKPNTGLPEPLQEVHLILWAFEDWLKSKYFEILKILENWCNDEITFTKGKAVDYVYGLLRDKPEQEANLLRLLVNKLGDSDKKISSKASYNIIQLETLHPFMKLTIINVIESDLLFRVRQSMHAKYYAIITLNQTVLSAKEEDVAKKLLDIYFSLFVGLLTKSEPQNSSSAACNKMTFNRKGERQGGGASMGKKAQKKWALQSDSTAVKDDLKEKMLSAVLTGVNRAVPYVTTSDGSFDAHLDTLFKVTHSSNFNTSVQALMLIQQLCGLRQAASDRFYRTLYESLLDPRLLTSSKQAMYLNLMFKALRADLKVKRVQAFAKRLLQTIAMHQPSFICGVIYLLQELGKNFASLVAFIDQPEENESDGEEQFHDIRDDVDVDPPEQGASIKSKSQSFKYDGKKREPEYSNADKSCLWELDPFLQHFHPSVALFASKLLSHGQIISKPDLSMNTLIHFLDRFVYRNPKKAASGPHGGSIMQPLLGGDKGGALISARSKYGMRAPVNAEAFWKLDEGKVDADEVFFHKYFTTLGKGKVAANKERKIDKTQNMDSDSEGNAEDEDEIWKALVDSRPELEGNVDSDADFDLEDLDSASELAHESTEAGKDEQHDINAYDLEFGDDETALLDSDAEVPTDLDEAYSPEVKTSLGDATGATQEKQSSRRRRLKQLPTFASADDYAAILAEDDEA